MSRFKVISPPSAAGIQRLFVLVRKLGHGGCIRDSGLAGDKFTKALFRPWEVDLDGSCTLEPYTFTRAPLVVDCVVDATKEVGSRGAVASVLVPQAVALPCLTTPACSCVRAPLFELRR